jgi:hypothetical protein
VFDPGLGQVRAGFFFSRYGFNFRAAGERSLEPAQKQAAREIPAPGGRSYSRRSPQVKAKPSKNRPNLPDLARFAVGSHALARGWDLLETNRFRRR